MILKLENYRCHKNITLEFPNTGLVLLSGKSGIGKSTILSAIQYVLYNKPVRPQTIGSKDKCKVIMEMSRKGLGWIKVTRKHTPCVVNVSIKYEDKEEELYEGDACDSIIEKFFGGCLQNFQASSYIRQKHMGSLLYMSNKDQLQFIENIAFQDVPVEIIRTTCKEKISNLKKILEQNKGCIMNLEAQIENIRENKVKKPKESKKCIEKWRKESVELSNKLQKAQKIKHEQEKILSKYEIWLNYNKEVKELEEKSKERSQKIHKEIIEIKQPWEEIPERIAYKEYEQLTRDIRNLEKLENIRNRIDKLNKDSISKESKLKEKLQSYIVKYSLDEIHEKISDIKSDIIKIDHLRERYDLQTKILNKLLENELIKEYKENCNLSLKKEEAENNIKELNNKIMIKYEYVQEIKNSIYIYSKCKEVHKCPCCNEDLQIVDGIIVKSEKNVTNDGKGLKEMEEKLYDEENKLKRLKEKYGKMSKILSQLSTLEGIYLKPSSNRDSYKILEKLREELQNVKKRDKLLDELEMYKKHIKTQKAELNVESRNASSWLLTNGYNLDKSIGIIIKETSIKHTNIYNYIEKQKSLQIEVDKLKYELENNPYKNTIQSLKSKMNFLNKEEDEVKILIEECKEKIKLQLEVCKKYNKRVKKSDKHMKKVKQYDNYISWNLSITAKESELTSANEQKNQTLEKLESFVSLQEIMKDSEHIALDSAVYNINKEAEIRLENMFDIPISVNLTTIKTLKNKSTKSQINTTITYKDKEYDSLDQVSGGEQDRISLAYTIALNNTFNSPILLLDECLSSLDTELNTHILMNIKEIANNKLVIVVSHEAERGLFDKVYDIEKLAY